MADPVIDLRTTRRTRWVGLLLLVAVGCAAPATATRTSTSAQGTSSADTRASTEPRHADDRSSEAAESAEGAADLDYQVPAEWTRTAVAGFTYDVLFGPVTRDFRPNLWFTEEPSVGTFGDHVVASAAALMQEFAPTCRIQERAEFHLDSGIQAAIIRYTRKSGDRDLVQTSYLIDTAPNRFLLTCTRTVNDPSSLDDDCDAVARSFRVIQPSP